MQAVGEKGRGPINQDWQFSVGGFFVTNDTKVTVNGEAIEGNEVDWDNEFDLGDKDQIRLDAFWRFAERHKIRLMYFQNNRSNTKVTDREITFNGDVYPVNSSVTASLDEKIIELAYEYAFYKTDTLELSGSAGLHTLKFEPKLSATLTSGPNTGTFQTSDASVTGPLPVLGFHALWDMGHNLYLDGLVQFFYISFDEFDGSITDGKVTLTWMPWQNIGFGVGWNSFKTRVDVSKSGFDGKLKFGYGGAIVFVTFAF
ncbi:MAG TPA: hypothetical protein VKB41_08645 [Steroidobacteraceae bacterium]|nr:hypothetical protein [Steroidobacteraceae bacterium]